MTSEPLGKGLSLIKAVRGQLIERVLSLLGPRGSSDRSASSTRRKGSHALVRRINADLIYVHKRIRILAGWASAGRWSWGLASAGRGVEIPDEEGP